MTVRAAETRKTRIWLIGDSNAWLLKPELAWIARHYPWVVFDGVPVPGSSVISWANGYDREMSAMRRFRPDVVAIGLGSNDAYMGPRVIKNEPKYLQKLLDRIPYPVIWIGPPLLEKVPKGQEAFTEMILNAGIPFLDSRDIEIEMWEDKLHPSPKGRLDWAYWTWTKLLQALDPSDC